MASESVHTGRMTGNTTRLVDQAIQSFFNGEEVLVKDHYGTRESNLALLARIKKRLVSEHPGSDYRVREKNGNVYISLRK